MRYSAEQKTRIRQLRSEGKSYQEIQRVMGIKIAKGTLSYICSGVQIPDSQKVLNRTANLKALAAARRMALVVNRNKRRAFLAEIELRNRHLLDGLSLDSLKIALAMLYLGEGAKWRSFRGLSLGSSDENIIRLYLLLLNACYGIRPQKLKARVQYRADQNINELEAYWSKLTGIPMSNFYKTTYDKRTVGKPTKKLDYRGVCVIMGGGTEIQLELAAIAKLLLEYKGH